MVGGEDYYNRLSAFTQNNVLQHIYSVGKTFTVLALSEVGDAPCGYSFPYFFWLSKRNRVASRAKATIQVITSNMLHGHQIKKELL